MTEEMSIYSKMTICHDMAVTKFGIYRPYLENYERQLKNMYKITKVQNVLDFVRKDVLHVKIILLKILKCKYFDIQATA